MKFSQGFSRPGWAIVIVAGYTASFTFITLALKRIDLGPACAIRAGIGHGGRGADRDGRLP
jgi:small multidrug resistance pump